MTQPPPVMGQGQRPATDPAISAAQDSGTTSTSTGPEMTELEPALSAAEQFLIGTAEIIGPDTSAPELLSWLSQQRKILAALAAACRRTSDTTDPERERQ